MDMSAVTECHGDPNYICEEASNTNATKENTNLKIAARCKWSLRPLLSYYHPPRVVNIKLMTALHIRKNVREFFPWAASLPGTAVKVCKQWQPDEQTIKNAIYSSRVSIATFFNHIH
jgi:hypothetical protein